MAPWEQIQQNAVKPNELTLIEPSETPTQYTSVVTSFPFFFDNLTHGSNTRVPLGAWQGSNCCAMRKRSRVNTITSNFYSLSVYAQHERLKQAIL